MTAPIAFGISSSTMASTALLTERDTHAIPSLRHNRLIADSRGLGWNDLYLSLTAERPWTAELDSRPHDCLVYCLNGQAQVERRIDGAAETERAWLKPRMFSLIPGDHRSTWSIGGTPDIVLIYLHRRLKDEIAAHRGGAFELLPRLAQFDPLLEQLCVALLGALRERSRFGGTYADQLARTAMFQLANRHAATDDGACEPARRHVPVASAGVRRAIDYLQTCLGESLCVETLAEVAGASVPVLVRSFKTQTGMTPYQYLLRERIARAKLLLVSTRRPVSEIALDTGFSTPSHFTSAFRRKVGITPTVFRRGS